MQWQIQKENPRALSSLFCIVHCVCCVVFNAHWFSISVPAAMHQVCTEVRDRAEEKETGPRVLDSQPCAK